MKSMHLLVKSTLICVLTAFIFMECSKQKQYSRRIVGAWRLTQASDGAAVNLDRLDNFIFLFHKDGNFESSVSYKSPAENNEKNTNSIGAYNIQNNSNLVITAIIDTNGNRTNSNKKAATTEYEIQKLTAKELAIKQQNTDNIVLQFRKQ